MVGVERQLPHTKYAQEAEVLVHDVGAHPDHRENGTPGACLRAAQVGARAVVQAVDLDGDGVADPEEDLNGDGDFNDEVAKAVRVDEFQQTVLPRSNVTPEFGVASRDAAIVGLNVYLHVLESEDDFDWNGDADKDKPSGYKIC